jgi:hypothetical protein
MAKERVISYRYFKPNSKQPRFVYIDVGYDKSVLPIALRGIVEEPRITEIDISDFGPRAIDLFLVHHYIAPDVSFTENEG